MNRIFEGNLTVLLARNASFPIAVGVQQDLAVVTVPATIVIYLPQMIGRRHMDSVLETRVASFLANFAGTYALHNISLTLPNYRCPKYSL